MQEIILVPIDGSPLAESVLPYVRQTARWLDATIHLIQVISDDHVQHALAEETPAWSEYAPFVPVSLADSGTLQHLRLQSDNYLANVAAHLEADGFTVTTDVHFGNPVTRIVETAANHNATLIAMATHGYGGFKRFALGSITDKVVRHTNVPVLVIRGDGAPQEDWTLRSVLVPLDGSLLARQALPVAATLAHAAHAEVRLLQAVAPALETHLALHHAQVPLALYGDVLPDGAASLEPGIEAYQLAQRSLHDVLAEYAATDVAFSTHVAVGHPAETIIEEAVACQVDLIVMATHGYGGLKRLALGSVADQVLHGTTTPLLLLRGSDEQPH